MTVFFYGFYVSDLYFEMVEEGVLNVIRGGG